MLMTWSLRLAPSATLAHLQYLEIPLATVFGRLIFNELPNGLAVILREQLVAKRIGYNCASQITPLGG